MALDTEIVAELKDGVITLEGPFFQPLIDFEDGDYMATVKVVGEKLRVVIDFDNRAAE
jgi:hypothetical protein